MQRDFSTVREFLAKHREIYVKAVLALAQGQIPAYCPQEEQEVMQAYGFVANMAGGDGNIFTLHLQEPLFSSWRACMNRSLAKATDGQMALALGSKILGAGRIALILIEGAEPLHLVLSAGAQPFQFCSDDAGNKWSSSRGFSTKCTPC